MLNYLRKLKVWMIETTQMIRAKKFIKKEVGEGIGIEVNLLLLAHALEKGMGLPNPRPHFGHEKAVSLLEFLEKYREENIDIIRFAYVEAVNVLGAYFEFTDNDMKEFVHRYHDVSKGVQKCRAGYFTIQSMNDLYGEFDTNQVECFVSTRHSIRNYINKPIDQETLRKVIRLANYAPSACNRQPTKVYVASDEPVVKEIAKLVPGNKGFEEEVPNWMIVTTNKKMFGINEPLQWYVNGGIYIAYLVQALHAYHLGSCIFQIPGIHPATDKLRNLASIPANESIIAVIGFGYAQTESKVLAAERRPVDEVLVQFKA